MKTLMNNNNGVAVYPIVITIDDDDQVSKDDSNSRDNNVNLNDLAKCVPVQNDSAILLTTPVKINTPKKRCVSDDGEVSHDKEAKRLKVNDDMPTENQINKKKTTYIFMDGTCDYYMEKLCACSKRMKRILKHLKSKGDTMITALELVKSCNQTLEQQMHTWDLEVVKNNTYDVFEKFIENCQIVCAADKTLDMETKEWLVISLCYNYPSFKIKDATDEVISTMENIVSISQYDSVISEVNLKYFKEVATAALQNASILKSKGWLVKEMTDEIRDGFFQDGKPLFPSPCCSTKAVDRQKILVKNNLASGQVQSAIPTKLSQIGVQNGTRTVSASAGSATSSVQNNVKITNKISDLTSCKMVSGTSCLAKATENPALGSAKALDFIPISTLSKENGSGRSHEINSANSIPTFCKSVTYKPIDNNVQNAELNLSLLERNRNNVLSRTISSVNNNLVVRNNPLNQQQENQRMYLVSQFERAEDLVPMYNSNLSGGTQFVTAINPQNQAIVQFSNNGNVNTLYTSFANNNQNFSGTNNLNERANFFTNNNNNNVFYEQFKNSLQSPYGLPALNIPLPLLKLRPIAIDGSNIAFSHGKVNHKFSCKGIELCVKHFMQLGHTTVKAFVPHFRTRNSKEIVNGEILHQLGKKQIVVFTPSRQIDGRMIVCYDDRFILDYAVESGAVVVSNDNFRDLLHESPQYNFVIKNRLLMYTFVEDVFLIPKDPLGRQGPDLNTFLRF